jgi:hypothetical protein
MSMTQKLVKQRLNIMFMIERKKLVKGIVKLYKTETRNYNKKVELRFKQIKEKTTSRKLI